MTAKEMKAAAKRLKPKTGEISQITVVSKATQMRTVFSVYVSDGNYFLVEGRLRSKNQDHTVIKAGSYDSLVTEMMKATA